MREEKLMARISRGDRDAAEELVRLLYPELLRYCLWHVPRRDLAEDAVQETFLKAIRYYDRCTGNCRAFLYRIAANTCIDLQRKAGSGGRFGKCTAQPLLEILIGHGESSFSS